MISCAQVHVHMELHVFVSLCVYLSLFMLCTLFSWMCSTLPDCTLGSVYWCVHAMCYSSASIATGVRACLYAILRPSTNHCCFGVCRNGVGTVVPSPGSMDIMQADPQKTLDGKLAFSDMSSAEEASSLNTASRNGGNHYLVTHIRILCHFVGCCPKTMPTLTCLHSAILIFLMTTA